MIQNNSSVEAETIVADMKILYNFKRFFVESLLRIATAI